MHAYLANAGIRSSSNKEMKMNSAKKSPACFLRWTVRKVNAGLYAVSATIDGKAYDFVGNFKSALEAQKAGRRYTSDLLHNSLSGGSLSLK